MYATASYALNGFPGNHIIGLNLSRAKHDYKKAQKHLLLLYANRHIEYAVVVVCNLYGLPCNGMEWLVSASL